MKDLSIPDTLHWRPVGNRIEEAETHFGRYVLEFFWDPPAGFCFPVAVLTKPSGRDVYLALERDASFARNAAERDYMRNREQMVPVAGLF
jgi:hypothetical protein